MFQLTICSGSHTIAVPAEAGQTVSELLQQNIPSFALPCAGNHTCGKCRVKIEGNVSPLSETEKHLLREDDIASGIRLACACTISGNTTVTVQAEAPSKIIAWYQTPEYERTESGYGFAVDIGTTTVAVQLIERQTGTILAERLAENIQRGYGADVISRIEACKTDGLDTLSDRIADQLEQMAQACLRETGITQIAESVVTGNSTMLHLYEGLDPASLAVIPFNVQSYFGCYSRRTLAGSPVYLPRCIGAYIGADIVCAILAADLAHNGTQLLADIGTNGEMALLHNGRLLCCSTAAGPAFEGAGLSSGMPAAAGAIRAVRLEADASVSYETVQDVPAVGICGSGILDALAIMLETEIMDDTGYLELEDEDAEDWQIGDSGISITQKDIRQIQLAKSAVCGGLLTLLEKEDISVDDVSRFVVAGGFGNTMNHASAAKIGLFPAGLQHKTAFIGNGALGGAAMLLMNQSLREQTERMAQEAEELSLSTCAEFMDYYIDCMAFDTF
ncbi:MAG: ASKHA domain-containing protein [Clostridia bacterium]|nr:ASKHA domain-containing protein [Clostridia bacterium]